MSASSGGLRSKQYVQGLIDCGHNVSYSTPTWVRNAVRDDSGRDNSVQDGGSLSPGKSELLHDADNQVDILEKINPDTAVWISASSYSLPERYTTRCRKIADLHNPLSTETSLSTGWAAKESAARGVRDLSQFDALVTASERQKWFWLSQCLAAGEPGDQLEISIIPPAFRPGQINRTLGSEPVFVYAGGFGYKHNPFEQLRALGAAFDKLGLGKIIVLGSPRDSAFYQSRVEEKSKSLAGLTSVLVQGDSDDCEALRVFESSWAAIQLMERSVDRELAVSTQAVHLLSMGVPLVCNHYDSVAEDISHFKAGWQVDPEDTSAVLALAEELLDTPKQEYLEFSKNALRLAGEKFSYQKSVEALGELCRQDGPRADKLLGKTFTRVAKDSRSRVLVLGDVQLDGSLERAHDFLNQLSRKGLISSYTTIDGQWMNGPHFDLNYDIVLASGRLHETAILRLLESRAPFVREFYPSTKAMSDAVSDPRSEMALAARATSIILPNQETKDWYCGRFGAIAEKCFVIADAFQIPTGKGNKKTEDRALFAYGADVLALEDSAKGFCRQLRKLVSQEGPERELQLFLVDEKNENNGEALARFMADVPYSADLSRWQLSLILSSQPNPIALLPFATNGSPETNVLRTTTVNRRLCLHRGLGIPTIYSGAPVEETTLEVRAVQGEESWSAALENVLADSSLHIKTARESLQLLAVERWHPVLRRATLGSPAHFQKYAYSS